MSMMIAPEVLKPETYLDWSIRLRTYLKALDVWDVIESDTQEPSDIEAEDHEITVKTWRKNNAMALYAIQMSCGDSFSLIRDVSSAKLAWDTLAERYNKPTVVDLPVPTMSVDHHGEEINSEPDRPDAETQVGISYLKQKASQNPISEGSERPPNNSSSISGFLYLYISFL